MRMRGLFNAVVVLEQRTVECVCAEGKPHGKGLLNPWNLTATPSAISTPSLTLDPSPLCFKVVDMFFELLNAL